MSKATDLVAVARDAGASGYVNVAGDAMTGSLTIDGTNNNFFFDSTLGAIRLRTNEGVEKATIRLGGNDMFVEVANIERLRIDSAGRVTMPYQPAFMAVSQANTFTPPSGSGTFADVYTTAKLNRGSHYNTGNGRFTAPVTGVYFFYHQMSARTASSATYEAKLMLNGTPEIARAFNNGAGQSHFCYTSTVISLSAGDYVMAGMYTPGGVVFSGSDDISSGSNGIVSGWGGYLIG